MILKGPANPFKGILENIAGSVELKRARLQDAPDSPRQDGAGLTSRQLRGLCRPPLTPVSGFRGRCDPLFSFFANRGLKAGFIEHADVDGHSLGGAEKALQLIQARAVLREALDGDVHVGRGAMESAGFGD